MTTVARQITATSLRAPALVSQQPHEVKAYIMMPDKTGAVSTVSSNSSHIMVTKKNVQAKQKTVSFSDSKSPPPPPMRTTSSRSGRPPHKEEVVLRNPGREVSPIQAREVHDANRLRRLSGSYDVRTGGTPLAPGDESTRYMRQRSKTETVLTMNPSRGNDNPQFYTLQGRGKRFNPYTGTMSQGALIHSKFSASQPQLNTIDQQNLVKPNDRIRKSMFDQDPNEQDESMDEEYGSGYRPTLMKISHGDVQKHAVAVTTPIVPSRMSRAGSEPNILETHSKVSPVEEEASPIPNQTERERSSSVSSKPRHNSVGGAISGGGDAMTLTTPIARAYREHLMEKIEKEKKKSVSPSPSGSSADSPFPPQNQAQIGESLTTNIQNISPTQFQGLDAPDRACYPRILPPPILNTENSKQEQLSKSVDNGGYRGFPFQPFQGDTSNATTGYYVGGVSHTNFTYGTLPRNKHGLNQVQGENMGLNYRAQSVSELYSSQMAHAQSQMQSLNDRTDQLSNSYSAVHQTSSQQAGFPTYLTHAQSQEIPAVEWSSNQQWRGNSHSSSVSTSSSQSSSTVPYSPASLAERRFEAVSGIKENSLESKLDWRTRELAPQSVPVGILSHDPVSSGAMSTTSTDAKRRGLNASAKNGTKPPVMPKPSLPRRNGSVLTNQHTPNNHERSTSDPSLKYDRGSRVATVPPTRNGQGGPISPTSPMPLTPYPHSTYSFESELQMKQAMLCHQHGRPKHRHTSGGVHHLSTSLLEIREADEMEEHKASGSEVKFFDYVSLNSALLPKRVQVSKGFCSDSTEVTMSQGEEFNLHFVRQVKAGLVTDSNNIRYMVPLNSVAKFSVIYDPFGVDRVATMGFHFKTAGVIMDLKNPPHVVAATQDFNGGRAESSVERGEILFLNGIKNVFHGRLLKVVSLKHGVVKYLDEKCSANFTTTPTLIKMTLAQIYESSISLPQKLLLYPPESILNSIPTSLQANPVLLKQFMVTKSVIATPLTTSSEVVPVSKSPAVSISLDLDIEVHEVPMTDKQVFDVREKTQALLDNFETISITPYVDMPSTASYVSQCALLLNLDPKLEFYEAETIKPNSIRSPKDKRNFQNHPPTVNGPAAALQAKVTDERMESRIKAIESKYNMLESKVLEIFKHLKKVSTKVDKVHVYLSKAQDAMTKHKKTVQEPEAERRHSQKSNGSPSAYRHSSPLSNNVPKPMITSIASSISSKSSNDRTDSRLSSKCSSESESIEGNDPRSPYDDVFLTKPAKPPLLPKPKSLMGTRKKTDVMIHAGKTDQKAVKNPNGKDVEIAGITNGHGDNPIAIRSGSGSPAVAIPLVKCSSRDSIDLKDYLLENSSKAKTISTNGVSANGLRTASRDSEEDVEVDIGIDAMADELANWCSQVEDELTQLYNESILSAS